MIITRKIQVAIFEEDKTLKQEYYKTLYDWRHEVRKAANIVISHKFTQDNIRDFVYIKDEIKDKFYVKDIVKEGKGMSVQNTTYRVLTELLKGKVPSDIYSCLNQEVSKIYKETQKDVYTGRASLRSYKNNIPIPFSGKSLKTNLKWDEETKNFYFSLFGLPFVCVLGADRSNNKVILERGINGEYKIASSSIVIDDKKKKVFLLICVDIPQKEISLNENNITCAFLSLETPIQYCHNKKDKEIEEWINKPRYSIGTKDEFLYPRLQIQAALKRAQIAAKYNKGGKGRKKKLKNIERFSEKEKKYVNTKLHTYSKILVEVAVKNGSSQIVLINQELKEKEAEQDEFLLRNWSYYGLIEKIKYKASMYGISVEKKNFIS